MNLMNATGYHTDAKCCHAGAKWLDCAGLRFSLHHGRLEQPSRVRRITPLPATSCHDCANLLFDARYPFILRPKPSINIKISIDNGSFDYSERCVRGNGCEVQPFHGTDGCPPCQARQQVIKPLDGQPRGLPTTQHQSAYLVDTTRQRHAGLFAD